MFLSIIIPCKNESEFIDKCLSSIFNSQGLPEWFEVIIVDGRSVDGTRDQITEWQKSHKNIILIDNPKGIVPVAFNLGIKVAKGDLIMGLGAHAVYNEDYIRNCIATSTKTNSDNVGGILLTIPRSDTMQAKLVQAITTHRFGVGDSGFRVGAKEGPMDTVAYGCYKRDIFDRIGYFDERLVRNQDFEFNKRILQSGGSIWCNPIIYAEYFNQATLIGLYMQALNTGQWNPWMWYLAPYSFAFRHTIPGVFVLGLIFSFLISVLFTSGWIFLALILVPYFLLAVVASIQQSSRYSWNLFPFLPFLFLGYHLSYGTGILIGCIKLMLGKAPVLKTKEPWPGAGKFRAWPLKMIPKVE